MIATLLLLPLASSIGALMLLSLPNGGSIALILARLMGGSE